MAGNTSLTRNYDRIFSIMRDEALDPYLWDNISTRTALLYALKQAGAIRTVGGTPHLSFKILKELPTTVGYTDLGIITPSRGDPVTRAIYDWQQLACPVQVSGLDMIRTGSGAEPELLDTFIESAEVSMREAVGGSTVGIFSSGADTDTGTITGLQTHFTTTNTTGQVGRISRASQTAWRHQYQTASGAFDTNGLNVMTTLYRQCTRFDEAPNITVLTGSAFDNFLRETTRTFQTHVPFNKGEADNLMVEAGFPNVKWFGSLVFADDGAAANTGYMINTKFVGLYVREGRNAEISDFIKSREYDDLVAYVFWAGNLCNTNLARGGLLASADTY